LLDERQGTDRDERLGHGGDAEDRIHLDGHARLRILHPDRVGMDGLAVACDEHHHPRNLSFLHIASRQRRELLEACGGNSVSASTVATLSRSTPDKNRNGHEGPCEALERWHIANYARHDRSPWREVEGGSGEVWLAFMLGLGSSR